MVFSALALLHIVVAAIATGYILVNKSDVRSAIGWIGLIWLSPFVGAAIYSAFGINRVARRASRINRDPGPTIEFPEQSTFNTTELDVDIRPIADVGSRVTKLPLTHGNSISMLRGDVQAYPEMLSSIANARRSIALATYIFRHDQVGSKFVAALIAARKRGVEVRVLIDGIGSGYIFSPVVRRLLSAGIPTTRFMHDWRPWRMSFVNLRNHKKLIVVDGTTGFAGGLNLGNENNWTRTRKREVDDIHFRVDGPVVGQLMISFAEDWHFSTGETLDGRAWWPIIRPKGGVIARGISSGPDEDVGSIETILAAALGQAKHDIRIVTPYFLPDEQLKSAIILAGLRGVRIELLIPERSDHVGMDWAMRAHLSFFPVERMKCFTTPKPFDHSKLLTVDGKWCAVGSPNWDVRSLRLNFEFLLECYDEGTVATIDALIDEKISRAKPLTSACLSARPLIARLRDASARLFLPYL